MPANTRWTRVLIRSIGGLLVGLLMGGCSTTSRDRNRAPVFLGIMPKPARLSVLPGSQISLTALYADDGVLGIGGDYIFAWTVDRLSSTSSITPMGSSDGWKVADRNPGIWEAPAQLGFYRVTVTINDGLAEDSGDAVIEVTEVVLDNKVPTMMPATLTPAMPITNDIVDILVTASDEDTNGLTWTWVDDGTGDFLLKSPGKAVWKTAFAGDHVVRVVVNDGQGGLTEQRIKITVMAPAPPAAT